MPTLHNETPAPDFQGGTRGDEFRDKEILFSYAGFTQKGRTLTPGQGIIPAGCVMGRVTATKKWSVYANGASDGTEVARGVLRDSRDTGTVGAPQSVLGNIVIAGILRLSMLSGLDANAITDLNGSSDTVWDKFGFGH